MRGQVEAELRGELMGILDFIGSLRNQRVGEVMTNAVACPRNQTNAAESMTWRRFFEALFGEDIQSSV
jgi:hypothetical protein